MKEIKQKIIETVSENKQIQRYQELEKFINNNDEIAKKMEQLKELQKQMIHAKEYGKTTYLKSLENEYNELIISIENSPLMAEYLDLQLLINNFLADFSDIIEKGLNNDLTPKSKK